jgi:hypothetical protein
MSPHRRGETNGRNPSDRLGSCAPGPAEPAEVLACSDLAATCKRQILERWRHDALELQTADDEAMSGGEEPMMQRLLDALNELERQTGAPRKRGTTACSARWSRTWIEARRAGQTA